MSTVVCHQGLQSCIESQIFETTVRLNLAAPRSLEFGIGRCMLDADTHSGEKHLGSWSFVQLLSNVSHQGPREETDGGNSYVHPLSKRSPSSRLSGKSLELCTENLGSETGTDNNTTEESIIFSSDSLLTTDISSSPDEKLPERDTKQRQLRPQIESRKVNPRTFPPPLTTISGSDSLRVRPHREGGRLIIKAEESPSTHTYLQAERSNGRLILSLLKNYASNIDSEETNKENGPGNINNYKNEDEINPCENDSSYGEEQEEDNREESHGGGDDDVCRRKEIDGNSSDMEDKKGMDKFQRPSRCKEDGHGNNKGLCNWEHLCVATSYKLPVEFLHS